MKAARAKRFTTAFAAVVVLAATSVSPAAALTKSGPSVDLPKSCICLPSV